MPTLIAVPSVVCKVALAVQRKLKLLDAAAMLEDLPEVGYRYREQPHIRVLLYGH